MTEETEKLPFTLTEELRGTLLKRSDLSSVWLRLLFVNPILEFLTRPISGLQNLHAIEITETMAVYMRWHSWAVSSSLCRGSFYNFAFCWQGVEDKERKNLSGLAFYQHYVFGGYCLCLLCNAANFVGLFKHFSGDDFNSDQIISPLGHQSALLDRR